MDRSEFILAQTRNPYEIATFLKIDLSKARQLMRSSELEPIPGWGRVNLQPYILSRKRRFADWPQQDKVQVHEARKLHDQGKVIMCQGYDGDWVIQYAIPTKRKHNLEPYFTRREIY